MAIKVEKVEKELNIQEILVLEGELNGLEYKRGDEVVTLKGLIAQPLWQSVKIHLSRLNDQISSIKEKFFSSRDELIKKYGEEVSSQNGKVSYSLEKNIEEYKKEENDLLAQTFPITIPLFDEEDLFGFKSGEEVYGFCYKTLLKHDNE